MSWRARPVHGLPDYDADAPVDAAVANLASLPPLVTSWEIERLRAWLAEAEEGKRFILQGGDCAERIDDCRSDAIANKLKILLQMSLILVQAIKKPVVRVARLAGQYAKPRTSTVESRTVEGVPLSLPSYFGDLINRPGFTPSDRRPDPWLLVRGYTHAALTLNFVRSLSEGGFADLHHPEYWDLSFFKHASLSDQRRADQSLVRNLADGLRFMEALGERSIADATRVDFFTSHEGLSLWYESAQTRRVPRRRGWYDLTTHLPWIGERSRALAGAHIEFFRGVRNPVGVKIGPKATTEDVLALAATLNPGNEPGKLVLIARMGADHVDRTLPPLLAATRDRGVRAAWMCDPMHGNGTTTPNGVKTRSFDAILRELEGACRAHATTGVPMAGVHFELTGEDVTECVGGASGVTEADLATNYASLCDPRLNYAQAMEMAFLLAGTLRP
jgi:3-deoxy-7-phosphoheptulonate synthase